MFFLKRPKINEKEARIGPFKKNTVVCETLFHSFGANNPVLPEIVKWLTIKKDL